MTPKKFEDLENFVTAEEAASNKEAPNNVLNFTTTLKELRKNVDPQLVKQREGWRDRNGNTSSASIPIALDECIKSGRVKEGSVVLLTAFGGGVTWGGTVLRF